jgi:hypothetical protein
MQACIARFHFESAVWSGCASGTEPPCFIGTVVKLLVKQKNDAARQEQQDDLHGSQDETGVLHALGRLAERRQLLGVNLFRIHGLFLIPICFRPKLLKCYRHLDGFLEQDGVFFGARVVS